MHFTTIKKHAFIGAIALLWIPAVGYGINTLWRYSATAGHPAQPPLDWPRTALIERAAGRATLVMFAHPQCGCSRASLGELAIIMAHDSAQVSASVLFYRPPAESPEWTKTDLWETAKSIPGVRVLEDPGGTVAQSFGVYTSGQTLFYDSSGRLKFKGGITAFRGHSGDNAGRTAITALLHRDALPAAVFPITSPVFGCSLRGE
jgi:hypothetical protein